MTDQSQDVDLQTLWQSQSDGEGTMSLEQIRSRARRLERRVARRNLREYVGAAFVTVFFGRIIWLEPSDTTRVGAGLIIAAALFVVYQLHVRAAAAPLPADLALSSALEFHRAQLQRQYDLLRSVWSWYLLPFVPGMLVLLVGQSLAHPARVSPIIGTGILCVVVFVGIHALNRYAAARIRQQLDRLKDDP